MKSKYERTVEQLTDRMSIAIEQCLSSRALKRHLTIDLPRINK